MNKEEIRIILRRGNKEEITEALKLYWKKEDTQLFKLAEKVFGDNPEPLPF